jgi:hypothetical protein
MKKLLLILLFLSVLVSCINKPVKEEIVIGQNEIRVMEQNKAFNKIVNIIIELSPYSTERHDILYKIVYKERYKYPNRLKMFDLEILSNAELIKVRDILNNGLDKDLEIARIEDEILRLEKGITIE